MQIYYGNKDKQASKTTRTLFVVSSGRVVLHDNDHMTLRRNGREDWSLFYCESGRLYIEDQVLQAGQLWIYPPKVPQTYITYRTDHTQYHYLHFTGSDIDHLFRDLNIASLTVLTVPSGSLTELFGLIQNALGNDSPYSVLRTECYALQLIAQLAENTVYLSPSVMLKRVTDSMEHSFAQEYDASRYAEMMHISRSRFDHLFREQMGVSPFTYYKRIRLLNAEHLLACTDLPIKQIAERCGYQSALYFTQAFKAASGLTPSAYRKKHK